MVPAGIEPSPVKMLQARLFSYPNAHWYRLGMNHLQLPVNCPHGLRVNSIHRDGFMQGGDNGGDRPDYYPNSYNVGRLGPHGGKHPYPVTGYVMRYNDEDDDNFSQPKELWHKGYNSSEREILVQNIADHVANAEMSIQKRVIVMYRQVAEDFAQSLEEALKNKDSSTAFMCNPV